MKIIKSYLIAIIAMFVFVGCSPPPVSNTNENTNVIPNGSGNYEDLISLFHEFLAWKDPSKPKDSASFGGAQSNVDFPGKDSALYPDYSEEAVSQRRAKMKEFHARLLDMAVSDWDISKQSEYLAVSYRCPPQRSSSIFHLLHLFRTIYCSCPQEKHAC